MKKIILLLSLLTTFSIVQGQLLKKIKEKVDKKVDKTIDDSANGKKDEKKNDEVKDTTATPTGNSNQPASFKSYSKYDFVPGEKVIGFEDFSTGNVGDLPAGWNTNAAGEIVTIDGKAGRWLKFTKPGEFVPELTENYPDDFTLEFDLLHGIPTRGASITICLAELSNLSQPQAWPYANNQLNFELATANPGTETGLSRYSTRKTSVSESGNQITTPILSDLYNPLHISIWRQKERVRMYCNQEKIWDIPKALAKDAKLNALIFTMAYAEAASQHYITNIRLAVGAPDTRNKMLAGKWVAHGILFDVNSANIKPESYGSLKEIANVLKENADLKVKIVGHTDADGKDADNLDLSKRRAASVKAALAKEFGIDESRMETDGKGETEPIDKNDTPAGKANNRRVEFIKL
jgi:outer membrane protein OmpA-like peptidoglycan-associated protein